MKSPPKRVAVIGGGWAGCAAAVELSKAGHQVTLFESARTLGGRARSVELNGKTLDNGQHILLGAYTDTLRLMRTVGIDIEKAFMRLPLQMRYPKNSHANCDGMDFIAPRLLAPLHMLVALLRATGLAMEDKMALARFSTTARWMDWRLNTDCTVSELLQRFDQTERLTKLMWRPLCIAALNTPPDQASAQVFLNVLRDSLGGKRSASDMLLPRVDLTKLFPQHAATFVEQQGGKIHIGCTVAHIHQDANDWHLKLNGENAVTENELHFDTVVIATQANHAAQLLASANLDASVAHALPDFDYQPITTCYLQYEPQTKLKQAFYALLDDAATGQWGQFVFDRGALDASQTGLLAVVVSASNDAIELDHSTLSNAIATQLAKVLQQPELLTPIWTKIISEKRATFSCTPALKRPENSTEFTGLVLAGDYTASDYPATLESAVRSGISAAQCLNNTGNNW